MPNRRRRIRGFMGTLRVAGEDSFSTEEEGDRAGAAGAGGDAPPAAGGVPAETQTPSASAQAESPSTRSGSAMGLPCPGCGLIPASACRLCPLAGDDRVPQGASGASGSGDPLPPPPKPPPPPPPAGYDFGHSSGDQHPPPPKPPPPRPPTSSGSDHSLGVPPIPSPPAEFSLEGGLGSSTDSNATNLPNDPADPYGGAAGDWARYKYVREAAPPLNPVVGPLPSVPTQGDDAGGVSSGDPQHRCPTCGAPSQPDGADAAPPAPSAAAPPTFQLPDGAQCLLPNQDMNGEWESYILAGYEWFSHQPTGAWTRHPRRARVYQ